MGLAHWWDDWHLDALIESYLPDFILAFAFFTSLAYVVLRRRFERQRPAIVVSAAMGLALSIGLVWWEHKNGFSVKDLGPAAIGFVILFMAFVMYQSLRQVGGSWAGAGITLGASILIVQLLRLDLHVNPDIVQTISMVALIVGLVAFLRHYHGWYPSFHEVATAIPGVRHDMADLYRERHLSNRLTRRMQRLRHESRDLQEHPEEADDIVLQLKRMLPAEGYLTERMAQLRAKAHRIRNGHVTCLQETRRVFAKLPASARKEASAELATRYNQLVGIDTRLERLDRAVAENERRIRELTAQAQEYAAGYNHQRLYETLKAAEKLQHHNTKLFKIIDRTEHKLSAIAKDVAKEVKQGEKPQ